MPDYFLRFPDKETWQALGLDRDPGLLEIDRIGTILQADGSVDGNGDPVMAAAEGWHVNVRVRDDRDMVALSPWLIHPVTPVRVWA